MKFITTNLTTILIIGIAVLVTWQVRGCFTKAPVNEKMIRSEERLNALEEKRLTDSMYYVREIKILSDSIAASKEKSGQLAVKYQTVKTIYEKIPINIRNLNNEDLRRAVWNY